MDFAVLKPPSFAVTLAAVLCFELALNYLITTRVAYTEIDWEAYMSEVDGYLKGERDYMNIRGGTGPLVYPAGFLYVYSFLRYLAGGDGTNIRAAQWFFVGVYMCNRVVVSFIYKKVFDFGKGRARVSNGERRGDAFARCFGVSFCLLHCRVGAPLFLPVDWSLLTIGLLPQIGS